MAPELSSNWKRLQAKLQASKPAKSQTTSEQETSLKRKRPSTPNEKPTKASQQSSKATGGFTLHKSAVTRKRQKMEEPASLAYCYLAMEVTEKAFKEFKHCVKGTPRSVRARTAS